MRDDTTLGKMAGKARENVCVHVAGDEGETVALAAEAYGKIKVSTNFEFLFFIFQGTITVDLLKHGDRG